MIFFLKASINILHGKIFDRYEDALIIIKKTPHVNEENTFLKKKLFLKM